MAVSSVRVAGRAIIPFYRTPLAADVKADGSPLTRADEASHDVLASVLGQTGIPVVSEEGGALHMEATCYWLVDPLDGTKGFLAASGEFTVNVALVEDGRPVLGVLSAPVLDELFVGVLGQGAWSERHGFRAACVPAPKGDRLRMATSRFHDHPDSAVFARANGVAEHIPVGAALKYGRMALGEIDVYPRLVGTSEWDTAAGQALLEAVGGGLLDWNTGEPIRYGKTGRRNGRFLALRAPYAATDFIRQSYPPELL